MKNDNKNLSSIKNALAECDFEISLTQIGQLNKISANFVNQENVNLYHSESFVNDNKQLKSFINNIAKLTEIKEMPKILSLLVQIHKYYGGQQVFGKSLNAGYVLQSDGLEMVDFNFNNLSDVLAMLTSLKAKIKKEQFEYFVSDLLDTMN